jgi:DEAD/DEAH box helicase domain-containing protein
MNFKNFYHKTHARLKDSILSLWATGDAEMQKYFSHILEKEKIMAEPVFQTSFPWAPADITFENTTNIFDNHFIKCLSAVKEEQYRFPLGRRPYRHQITSWNNLLNHKKSIVVTTGTGSGKTECFMLPVLYDIYKNCKNSSGVNAIFLYPLNALIGSQKKRIDSWCRAVGGINYAVYNGNTKDKVPTNEATKRFPELVSRTQIRETPPQILFTNPSMLEYILVRNKDVDLLNNSAGKLRWILLDEAHTLTGSAASEMSLLIRRVIDAFKVDLSQIRFAITSATVGQGEQSEAQLKGFMSKLCGISEENISIISGARVLAQELKQPTSSVTNISDILLSETPEIFKEVNQLRNDILKKPALTLLDIGRRFKTINIDETLEVIDKLSDRIVEGKSILPVRGHFFTRGIGGVYVCINKNCKEHAEVKPNSALGSMTTIAGTQCSCGSPLVELVACRSCGNHLLEGEKIIDTVTGREQIQMITAITQDPFTIDNQDDEDEIQQSDNKNRFTFTRYLSNKKYISDVGFFGFSEEDNIIKGENDFIEAANGKACPHCNSDTNEPLHFRLSSSFINRVLADIILEETPQAEILTKEMLWKGRKYISFTDSRQGTAKISALINQDNEANLIRSLVFHKLCEQKMLWRKENPKIDNDELDKVIEHLEKQLTTEELPMLKRDTEASIKKYKDIKENVNSEGKNLNLDWEALKRFIMNQTDFNKLYEGNNPNDRNPNAKSLYLNALMYDQFARRLPRERSLENLGMVGLIYPKLHSVTLSDEAKRLNINLFEWQSLLKISADYILRNHFHFFVNDGIYPYITKFMSSYAIYSQDTEEVNVKRWPKFEKNKLQQNRLALLICAGLGFYESEMISPEIEDQINELLEKIWQTLKRTILSNDGSGFKINLEEATRFSLCENLWLCPVKKRLLDVQFKGYSPWIKGNLTEENIRQYKIEKSLKFPEFIYPFNLDDEKNLNLSRSRQWIKDNAKGLKDQGVWNDLHEQVILNRPLYLSGEHSAQQNEIRLKELEDKFEKGELNILNCSTTMEMGVDIGGISAVVMNNVPPSPANYLQRTGRAGRRAEAKSLAFTICASNPVGLNAIENPMWALDHQIAPPSISFNSIPVVERHINAFFLGKFVQTDSVNGLNVRMSTNEFFFHPIRPLAELFSTWLLQIDLLSFSQSLKSIVKNTPIEGKGIHYLLEVVIYNFKKLAERTTSKNNGFEEKLRSLLEEFGEQSPAYKSCNFQKMQFLEKHVISYLAEEGFLPTSGMPTGIVEFDNVNIDDIISGRENKSKSKPSYFITRALSEFAPGNQIVLDGKSYISEGILLKNDRGAQAEREIIQSCTNCGHQRIIEVSKKEDINSSCLHCGKSSYKGINFKESTLRNKSYTEMIQPVGFAIDIYKRPTRKISERSNVQYVDPLLLNIKPWENESTSLFDSRSSDENAEILFYNIGSGNGYSVCLHCGRAVSDKSDLEGHKRLRGGKNNDNERNAICSGNTTPFAIHDHVILGGRFKTDFCEIRFKDENNQLSNDDTFLYTMGAILSKEFSHFLAIEESEIGFGIKHYDNYSSIFIFDTAKGGAGYSSQFTLYADEVFINSKSKLEYCNCEKACTKCLIDRQTQWHIDKLDRNKALIWLNRATSLNVPIEYSNVYPNLKAVNCGLKEEIGRYIYSGKIKEIWLYGSANISEWELDKLAFIKQLQNKINIHFVLEDFKTNINQQDKISFIQYSLWSDFWRTKTSSNSPLVTICKIKMDDGNVVQYMAESFVKTFNQNWSNINSGVLYKNTDTFLEELNKIEIKIDEQNIFETIIEEPNSLSSDQIASVLINQLHNKLDLKALLENQHIEITYCDRYIKTPFGCILMLQFVNQLRNQLGFSIESFKFKGQEFEEAKSPYYLYHHFKNDINRNKAVEKFAHQLGILNATAINDTLPHYRFFELKNNTIKIIIRPDAGIEHGWFYNSEKFNSEIQYTSDTNASNIINIKQKEKSKILYTISIEKN